MERIGLAMSGAIGGTFVAACLARASVEPFDSVGFVASMILVGVIGFYLGIDIPPMRVQVERQRMEAVELLSAIGTFLAAVAALVSVYAIVLDEVPQRPWQYAIGCWWLLGVMMQTAAGLVARLRLARAVR
jgi:hypothetical protein